MEHLSCAGQREAPSMLLPTAPCVLGVSSSGRIVLILDIRKLRLRERQSFTHDDKMRWDLDASPAHILALRASAFRVWRIEHLGMWENVCVHSVCVCVCLHTYCQWDRPGRVCIRRLAAGLGVGFWSNLWSFSVHVLFAPWTLCTSHSYNQRRICFYFENFKICWKCFNKEPQGNLQTSWKTKEIILQDGDWEWLEVSSVLWSTEFFRQRRGTAHRAWR